MLDFFEILHIIEAFHIEDLCNGSTPDSDSVCGGSNPSSSAKKSPTAYAVGDFLVLDSEGIRTHLNAARMSAAGDGLTEPLLD